MTRDEVKKMLPFLKAYAEGEKVEMELNGKWIALSDLVYFCSIYEYRIKPEPKYRPFENVEECWNEMQKHQPFGWLGKYDDEGHPWYEHIETVMDGTIWLEDDIDSGIMFQNVMQEYTFADGTPFGIKVEEE